MNNRIVIRLDCACVGIILGSDPENEDQVRMLVFSSCDGDGGEDVGVFVRKIERKKLDKQQTLSDTHANYYIDKLVMLAGLGNQLLLLRATAGITEDLAARYIASRPIS